ncbi:low affinity immunoglobulin gamma Fc region receptor III-like [Haemorhous mexicanus]|uniref:low affinity immunoglobulin gamma Fc region receptor III-like n=1 Tax=Haemorhous mexicanus TaxID=30427 RepID=UPI0028BE3109|nr:low affinity immunoglobulin gamma Fc region receptor III-like [Haemorhous mexicanus]
MSCPHPADTSPALALAGCCPLSPAGAQTTQLLVEPPWTPPVLWDRVTLTCQGSGSTRDTTWYKNRRRWWEQGHDRLIVTHSGTYACDRPGSGLSPTMNVSDDWLVLQVPGQALLEGDTVTLCCQSWRDIPITLVSFYHEEEELGVFPNGTQLSLSPLQLNHSGHYCCKGQVGSWGWQESALVTVTLHVPVANATITPQVLELTPQDTETHRDTVSRKNQERAPPDPPHPPEEGEVLYTHVVVTRRAAVSPRATTLQDPQVTHAELRGPQGPPREPGDIYGNVL